MTTRCNVANSVFMRLSLLSLTVSLSAAVLFTAQISAQDAADPQPGAMRIEKSSTGLIAHNDYETLELTVCGDTLIHVVARPQGASAESASRPWMLDSAQSCPGSQFQFSESGDTSTISTAKLTVTLSASRAQLSFSIPGGESLLREEARLPRTYQHSEVAGRFRIEARFSLEPTEGIYGLGQHQSGIFNYRGSTVELAQNNTDVAIPLLLSSEGYGIMWNSASYSYADNRFPLSLNFESLAADHVDYYFIYGPEMDQIIHQYRTMTGHAPLLPEWAYGLFQSKDRYVSQAEILDVAS